MGSMGTITCIGKCELCPGTDRYQSGMVLKLMTLLGMKLFPESLHGKNTIVGTIVSGPDNVVLSCSDSRRECKPMSSGAATN